MIPTARSAFGADDTGLLQILEDLFEKTHGNRLPIGNLSNLRGTTLVVKRNVEKRTHSIAALVGQLHGKAF